MNTLLSEQLRPKTLNDVVGQDHLIGKNGAISNMLEAKRAHSLIFWGTPGIGKTTLARILAQQFNADFMPISAVLSGVKDLREIINRASQNQLQNKTSIVFIDEIHRFNKSQQDVLLPHIESGLFILFGATTENPSFELNNALLSRVTVYTLKPLKNDDLKTLWQRAIDATNTQLTVEDNAFDLIANASNRDGRKFINLSEKIIDYAKTQNIMHLEYSQLKTQLSENLQLFDKGGEHFYNQISALHKSVRGSDPDAALFWLTKMLNGGVDPLYLGRRLVRIAWEDIGLADPRAAEIALNAVQTYQQLGTPEGELALAQAIIYLAIAPKSNAGYKAYNQAKNFVKNPTVVSAPVPLHLCNAPTKLLKDLEYGKGYRYSHDEPNALSRGQNYWPETIQKQSFYSPVQRGLELKIKEKLDFIKKENNNA